MKNNEFYTLFFVLKMEPYEVIEEQKSDLKALAYCEQPENRVTKSDYVFNLGLPVINFDNSPHICIVAKSQSGKTTFIANLIIHHFLH